MRLPLQTLADTKFRRISAFAVLTVGLSGVSGCRHAGFPDTPAGYREYAYVANSGANTVSVLDLVYVRADRTLQVGERPTALAVNPVKNEIYALNTGSGSVSVIDAETNRVVSTIPVRRLPVSIDVEATGRRAYVVNSGSSSVSVVDLEMRREIGNVGTGGEPGAGRLAPDGRSLVVPHKGSGVVSVFDVGGVDVARGANALRLRANFQGCAGAGDVAILPDSSKAFIACAGAHEVMALNLAADSGSWAAKQDSGLMTDHMLTLLEVGGSPVHLTLKPDGGEIFTANREAGSISEIATQTNEVGGTYMVGTEPVGGIVSRDNGMLYISNLGDDSVSLYSIDDGKLVASLHTGSAPAAMAFSADEHLLLAVDTHSGDVSVIRMLPKPVLFTILPAGMGATAIVTKVVEGKAKP